MAIKDSSEPATPSTSTTAGSVALLPEPFEVNERAVSLAAKAARDVLQRMSTGGLRRARREDREARAVSRPAREREAMAELAIVLAHYREEGDARNTGPSSDLALGTAITNGFKQFVDENGGKLGGREVEYFTVDDESNPAKATENAKKLVSRDKVDVLVGTVHSGVALAMAKVARDTKTLMIVPNAGANELTGPLCSPYIFRSSFSAWQPSYAMGEALAKKGIKNVATVTWKYSFGEESVAGFKEAFEKGGGKLVKEMTLPFPNVEFQPFLTEIAAAKPDAGLVFFAGAGAAKFVADYAAAGLKNSIPLYGPGFLTDGNLGAMGGAGEGLLTTLEATFNRLDQPMPERPKCHSHLRTNECKLFHLEMDRGVLGRFQE